MTEVQGVGEYMVKLEAQMKELMATKAAVEKNIAELTGYKGRQMTPLDVYNVARKACADYMAEKEAGK